MATRYKTTRTSQHSHIVNDVALIPTRESANTKRRRIIRTMVVSNIHDKTKAVKITLMHQRRASVNDGWKDADSYNPAMMKANEEIRLSLDSSETYQLYEHLRYSYSMAPEILGSSAQERTLVVTDEENIALLHDKADDILRANERYGPNLWKTIDELDPNFLQTVAMHKEHQSRLQTVDLFERQLKDRTWSEADWQGFFESNTWIFGHSLAFQFLRIEKGQPHYGGLTISGRGIQRGDVFTATEGDRRFIVLVEIKKPQTFLVETRRYRNKALELGHELVGGVSQLLSNIRTWEREGSEQEDNREWLRQQRMFTYEPKGILLIGHTEQLADMGALSTFELFRRNLHNPEILTYDELFRRAKYLVSITPPDA